MKNYECRIGVSPAGVVWMAYKPEHVELMHRKLTELWKQHEAKQTRRRSQR